MLIWQLLLDGVKHKFHTSFLLNLDSSEIAKTKQVLE